MSRDFQSMVAKVVGPLARRARLAASRCILTLINDSGGLQTVQVSMLAMPTADGGTASELVDNVGVVRQYGFTAHPHPGAEGVYLSVGGVRTHGVVIAIEDRRYRLAALAEGEVAVYDDLGQKVHLTRGGIVVDGAGLPMVIQNTPTLTVKAATSVVLDTPLVTTTGQIQAAKDIIDQNGAGGLTMATMRQRYDVHTHRVDSVQPGGGSVTSETPEPQE